jgi:hypothetical protein
VPDLPFSGGATKMVALQSNKSKVAGFGRRRFAGQVVSRDFSTSPLASLEMTERQK